MLTGYSKGTHRPTGRRTMKTMASLKGRALVSSSFIICRAERRGAPAGGYYVRVGTIGAAGLRQAALRLPAAAWVVGTQRGRTGRCLAHGVCAASCGRVARHMLHAACRVLRIAWCTPAKTSCAVAPLHLVTSAFCTSHARDAACRGRVAAEGARH